MTPQKIKATSNEAEFTLTLHPNAFYLKDHVIQNQKILPASAYIEIISQIAHSLNSTSVNFLEIKDLIWLKPIIVDTQLTTLKIKAIYEKEYEAFRLNIFGHVDHQEEFLHAQCLISFNNERSNHLLFLSSDGPDSDYQSVSAETLYHSLNQQGFQYGPSFKVVNSLYRKGNYISACVEPNASPLIDSQIFIHPGLLDGAFQAIAGLHLYEPEMKTYIPYSIKRIQLYKPLKGRSRVFIQEEPEAYKEHRSYEISITNPKKEILLKIEGYSARLKKQTSFDSPSLLHYYRPQYILKPFPSEFIRFKENTGLVLFSMTPSSITLFLEAIIKHTPKR